MQGELEIWRRRFEPTIDTCDDQTLEEVRDRLVDFVDMHSKITRLLESRKRSDL
jgi:hypothetical protein